MVLHLKEALRCLCCNNGWSYAVVWRLKCRDSMLLIPVGAYCEVESSVVGDQVLHQVHVVGEGVIGQVALTGKHRWIFSDNYLGEDSGVGPLDGQIVFQDTAEWKFQFLAGIKTVAIISVSSQRIIQFGSNEKIPESVEFVENIRSFFHHQQGVLGTTYGNSMKPVDSEFYDPPQSFTSLVTSRNSYLNHTNGMSFLDDSCKELTAEILLHSTNHLTSNLHIQSVKPHIHISTMHEPSASTSAAKSISPMTDSLRLMNCCPNLGANAQVILSMPNKTTQESQNSGSSSVNSSLPCNSSLSELSSYKFVEKQLLLDNGMEGSYLFPADSQIDAASNNNICDFKGLSFPTLLAGNDGSLETCVAETAYRGKSEAENHFLPLLHTTEGKLSTMRDTYDWDFRPNIAGLPSPSLVSPNHFNQSSFLTQEQINAELSASPSNDISTYLNSSLESDLITGDIHKSKPFMNSSSSLQNMVAYSGDSQRSLSDGKQSIPIIPSQSLKENGLSNSFGSDDKQTQGQKFWENTVLPGVFGDCPPPSTGASEYISTIDMDSLSECEKGLISDNNFQQLLDSLVGKARTTSKPNAGNQSFISTVMGSGINYAYTEQAPSVGFSGLSGGISTLLPKAHSSCGSLKDVLAKSLVSSWIESSNNHSAASEVISQTKKPEDPSKTNRKRARPGESLRPRPKDRQQIQDRVKELREIVPNGAKCSIDSLLDRTIKHMLFLQSVMKYADKLKQANEPKISGQENGAGFEDSSFKNKGGATWAFEVGGRTMVCPIIVEDLNTPGQMLVEMLCEERGFFLEIADTIRGYGLAILKGVIEVRDNKIWAQFVVEANRDINRMDVFMSLVNLLQQTLENSISSSSQPTDIIDASIPALTNHQQSPLPHRIGVADDLQ